jgi:RHS repeat-associated protein
MTRSTPIRSLARSLSRTFVHSTLGRLTFLGGCCLTLASSPNPAHATCATDTVVVYGSTRFYGGGGYPAYTLYDPEYFSTTTSWGRRYIIELRNGSPALSGVSIVIDGQEWIGTDEFGSGVSYLTRTVDFADGSHSHSIELSVQGGTSAYVDVRVYHVTEPMFKVYGRKIFIKPSPAAAQLDSFAIPNGAKPGYSMRILNGDSTGAHRTNNCSVKLNNVQVLAFSEFTTGTATLKRDVTLLGSGQQNKVEVNNQGASSSRIDVEFTATDSTAPYITLTGPAEGFMTEASSVTVAGSITDETPVTVTINSGSPIKTNTTFSQSFGMSADGNYTITVHAANSACFTSDTVRHVARDNLPPALTVSRPASTFAVDSALIAVGGSWVDTIMTYITVDGDTIASGKSGTFSLPSTYPLDLGPNRIVFRASDALGHSTTILRYVFRTTVGEAAPVDSVLHPPALPTTEITPFLEGVRWLYAGDTYGDTLQKAVNPDSIKPGLAAVVRGRVTARDFGGLPNVKVRVLGHDEFGYALTRADGRFDLVINGGLQSTLRFTKPGYLEAQRDVQPPVNDFVAQDNVAMIGRSVRRSIVEFNALRLIRGRFVSDANGDRRIHLLFKSGTVAKIARASGDTASFNGIQIRPTEYTVGSDGARTMPGLLPPGSAYTFCMDFSVDEADSIGQLTAPSIPVPDVLFTNPVVCLVRNFLNLPVGVALPNGFYDRRRSKWMAAKDGWVMKVLSDTLGTVTLDSNGDGVADSTSRLDSLGITSDERQKIAAYYDKNDVIWRMTIDRFSNGDFNPNMAGIQSSLSPAAKNAGQPQGLIDDPCHASGSIIECENRVLGQQIPIVGTPYTLNYRSFRAPGDIAIRSLRIPVSGDSLPPGISKIIVVLQAAGVTKRHELTPATNLVDTMTWNGLDVFGRVVQGAINARVSVGYLFPVTMVSGNGGSSLGDAASSQAPMGDATGDRVIGRIAWARQTVSLGTPSAGSDGLGGWTISPHHFYDMTGQGALYYGDGRVLLGWRQHPIIRLAAGNHTNDTGHYADNVLATTSTVVPSDVAVAPDGSLYIADATMHVIRRVDPSGVIRTIAGTGSAGNYLGDTLGTLTPLRNPKSLTVGPDGSVYFVMGAGQFDAYSNRVCRITADGWVRTIAGTGAWEEHAGAATDGLPATQAKFNELSAIALGPDGCVFVGDESDHTVRRIAPNGIIRTYAGNGDAGTANGVTGKATSIALVSVSGLTCDPDGNLYIAEAGNHRVQRVAPDGILSNFTQTSFNFKPNDIAFGPDGAMYIASIGEGRVYRRDPDGTIASIAGVGEQSANAADMGRPAAGAFLYDPRGIDVAPDGSVYTAEIWSSGGRVCRISASLPTTTSSEYSIPSEDGSEVYFFDLRGRHLRTRDALTGAVRFRFSYDDSWRLTKIHDANGDSTVISRSGATPTAIVAPYGQSTGLALDGSWLGTITDPAGQATTLTSNADGLLTELQDAKSNEHLFAYAADGRLYTDDDPAGGSQTLGISYSGRTRTVTRETGEHRTTTYQITDLSDGTEQRSVTGADGHRSFFSDSTDGRQHWVLPDGTTAIDSLVSEVRYGMLAPIPGRVSTRLPSGMTRVVEVAHPYDGASFNPPQVTSAAWVEETTINGRPPYHAEFDAVTRVLTAKTPLLRTTTSSVDSAGRPLSVTVGTLAPITFTYDGRARITRVEQGGRGWRYAYDTKGRVATVRDSSGLTTGYAYDEADRETLVTLPDGSHVAFGYDANGNLARLTPPGRPAHTFGYTAVDLNSQYTPPTVSGVSSPATDYEYNKDRQLRKVTRPDGQVVSLHYDAAGRLDSLSTARGRSQFAYSAGHLASVSSPDSVFVTYGYDGPLMTSEQWTGKLPGYATVTVAHAYNREFLDSTLTVGGALATVFNHDSDGLLTAAGGLSIHRRSSDGLMDSTYVAEGGGEVRSSRDYNHAGELANLRYATADSVLFQQSLTRDSLGRIVRNVENAFGTSRTWGYRYDRAQRLYGVTLAGDTVARYRYDPNGNRISFDNPATGDSASATYDDQDRMLRYMNTRYEYTAAGELLRTIAGADTTRCTYDALGNLVKVNFDSGDSLSYAVDGLNRRVGRRANSSWTRGWLYGNGANVVAELDSTGAVLNRYVYGEEEYVPALLVRGGITYRVITDYLGSVRGVVGLASGTVAQRKDYDAWGVPVSDAVPEFQSLGYAGGLTEAASGLVRFGARDYAPAVGRWSSKDPLLGTLAHGTAYAYVDADPINSSDPTGLLRSPEYCARLLERIINIQKGINRRYLDLRVDRKNLPWACPGDDLAPGLSVRGHLVMIEEDKVLLEVLKMTWLADCGGGSPPGGLPGPGESFFDEQYWQRVVTFTGLAAAAAAAIDLWSRIPKPFPVFVP